MQLRTKKSARAITLRRQPVLLCLIVILVAGCRRDPDGFHTPPYLQRPATDGITVIWFSRKARPGELIVRTRCDNRVARKLTSTPSPVPDPVYPTGASPSIAGDAESTVPFRHLVTVRSLDAGRRYRYEVRQGDERFAGQFRTAPVRDTPVRFIIYADSETQPASTGSSVPWPDPAAPDSQRTYLIDQTRGYANNLCLIREWEPDFIVIAGDLVEIGGEQSHWDEFWRHNVNVNANLSLAGNVPIFAVLGNHEYYAGPSAGNRFHSSATQKFLGYFPPPEDGETDESGRYYHVTYGPVSLVVLDVCNGLPHQSERDTNHLFSGSPDDPQNYAPDFNPESRQYLWLEAKLRDTQLKSRFTFVAFHHAPYSSGPHGLPPGVGPGFDPQTGKPVRMLTPLFLKYGVDAVFSGHDEMYERSEISGIEIQPSGDGQEHTIHFYDVGIGGDGLRATMAAAINPHRRFVAHHDAPEVWENGRLREGGKHYGHLTVDVRQTADGHWRATLTPVYVLPVYSEADRDYTGYERKVYDDVVIIDR